MSTLDLPFLLKRCFSQQKCNTERKSRLCISKQYARSSFVQDPSSIRIRRRPSFPPCFFPFRSWLVQNPFLVVSVEWSEVRPIQGGPEIFELFKPLRRKCWPPLFRGLGKKRLLGSCMYVYGGEEEAARSWRMGWFSYAERTISNCFTFM